MKAIISTTFDDQYLFYLPITTWLWNRIGVGVICFVPASKLPNEKYSLALKTCHEKEMLISLVPFRSPDHKEATYAQCARLFAGAFILNEDDILTTSDIDMGVFQLPPMKENGFSIFGTDLVPVGQFPMCYISATALEWRKAFNPLGLTYQKCLDNMLGEIECESFRGNYWGKDQETAWDRIKKYGDCGWVHYFERARPGTQFASNRIDRDDAYFMDRLSPGIIDYHFHRPGYTDDNFEKILTVIQYMYPGDDLTWMRDYQQSYKQLL